MEGVARDLVYRPDSKGKVFKTHVKDRNGKSGSYIVEGVTPNGKVIYRNVVGYRNRWGRPFAALHALQAKIIAHTLVSDAKDDDPFIPLHPLIKQPPRQV